MALRRKKNSTFVVGMDLVRRKEAEAFVSAGSTGALMAGAMFKIGRIKGIDRPALATLLPVPGRPLLMVDAGANVDCKPSWIVQFAMMGSAYMNRVMKLDRPQVGLLNIGVEAAKGNEQVQQTYALMEKPQPFAFCGNIEARDALAGKCDVLATDGFAGNVLLKTMEGVGSFAGSALKAMFKKNLLTKLAALCVMPGLNAFKAKLDPNKVGGTAFIGISRPVIKAHGSSNAEAIENAMGQAVQVARSGIIRDIEENVALMKVERE